MYKEDMGSTIYAHGVNRRISVPFITPGFYSDRLVPAMTTSDSSF